MTEFKGRYYVRICKICGEVFKTSAERAYICKACKCRKRTKSINRSEPKLLKRTVKKKPKDADITLNQMLERLERFNKKNGTVYTYGKFVSLLCNGGLK